MANKISGRIIVLQPTKALTSKSGNSYKRREFVIERIVFDRNTGRPTADSNDTIMFALIGDSCSQLDNAKVGDEVVVDYDIQGRIYDKDGEKKYFTDIRVFRVDVKGASAIGSMETETASPDPFAASPTYEPQAPSGPAQPMPTPEHMATDDLPF